MKDKSPIDLQTSVYNASSFWTIHLRRRQIFTILEPYLPTVGSFLLLSVGKFNKTLTPSSPPRKCRRLKWVVPNIKRFNKQNSTLRIYSKHTEFTQNLTKIDKNFQCAMCTREMTKTGMT